MTTSPGDVVSSGRAWGDPQCARERALLAEPCRALVAALPDALVLIVGPDLLIWVAEGQPLARDDRPVAELVGRRGDDVLPPRLAAVIRRRLGGALAGTPGAFEFSAAAGRSRHEVRMTPMHLGGERPCAVMLVVRPLVPGEPGSARSALAREEADELFRHGFDVSPIGMTLIDPESGRYLEVNDAACRLLGRTRKELLASRYQDITHPDDAAGDVAMQRAVLAAEGVVEYEKRYLAGDGSTVWASVHAVQVRRDGGARRAVFCQLVNLTPRKQWESQLRKEATDHERLELLRTAIDEDRLVIYAQPIIALRTGKVIQQELLVRLQDDDGEILPPSEFLPLAERFGLITDLDRVVTRRAIGLAAAGTPVEVNLSGASVGDERLLATIQDGLAETGADPALIVFEVTETAVMENVAAGRAFAEALRALGCGFALDDFGTGFGTFTYLKHIPIDYLKIDIEFVRDVCASETDARLIKWIVTMARDFGKLTIAEGVENAETLSRLRELGVDHAQGYHIGRPASLA